MVIMFDLRERQEIVRKMTDEEFNQFQELSGNYVETWNKAEEYLTKMVKKYIDNPNISILGNDNTWRCDTCGQSCIGDSKKMAHVGATNHRTFTIMP